MAMRSRPLGAPTTVTSASRSVEATHVDVVSDIDGTHGRFTVSGEVPYVCGEMIAVWYPGSKTPFAGVVSTVRTGDGETKVEWLDPTVIRDLRLHDEIWSGWTADEIIDYHARQLAHRFPA